MAAAAEQLARRCALDSMSPGSRVRPFGHGNHGISSPIGGLAPGKRTPRQPDGMRARGIVRCGKQRGTSSRRARQCKAAAELPVGGGVWGGYAECVSESER